MNSELKGRHLPKILNVWGARRWEAVILTFIILTFLTLGVAYATQTPKWEAPDEPAHYNYVKSLVEEHRFPVLEMGDYPHQYLEEIKAAKFPDHMSIDPIRYESHQPPLYYLLAALIYKITLSLSLWGRVVALRLLSLAFGGGLLVICYLTVKEIFPTSEVLALATTGLVATIPMHIAMSAAINNDTLAELILALILLVLVKLQKGGLTERKGLALGLLLGLGLLTKSTTYLAFPLALLAVFTSEGYRRDSALRLVAVSFGLALAISWWWFLRNLLTYGDFDIFGWRRHDAIVVGRPHTGGFDLAAAKHFLLVSFKSFWAQFGWMGILVDERIYLILFLVSALAGLGFLLFLTKNLLHRELLSSHQKVSLALLGSALFLIFASDLWYNLKFIQAQGRYLFPAIVPICLFFVIGLRELIRREYEKLFFSLLYLGFLALDTICLWGFIVPHFRN